MRGRMKLGFFALTVAVLAMFPGASADAQRADYGMTVWVDADYRGASHTFLDDDPDLGARGMGLKISAVRVTPGDAWEACTERNYGGRCRTFSTAFGNLNDIGWNDVIMSVRRIRGRGTGRGFPGGAPAERNLPPAQGLELYAGTYYSGARLVLQADTSDFRPRQYNDRAVSLRVPQNETWEICVNAFFDNCRVISTDVPDLEAIGFSRTMSSARRVATGRGRGRGRGWGGWFEQGRQRLVLYDGVNFSGRSMTMEVDDPNFRSFSGNAVGSAQVQGGGRWQLCEQPRYGGRCVTIIESERDLGRFGLRDVASVRRQ